MKVLVIGGIGGLATALSLHAVGIECEVFEQSRGIRELGVGINTLHTRSRNLPNSVSWTRSIASLFVLMS